VIGRYGSSSAAGDDVAQIGGRSTRGAIVLGGVSLLVALTLFRPWEAHPLPIRDFGATINWLSPASSAEDAYRILMDTFARAGRHQPAFMAIHAAEWSAFGASSVGRQILRFALMATIVILSTLFAVQCGASWMAALAAMGIWLILSNGQEAWYLLQAAEPLAALFVVIAALFALSWRSSRRPLVLSVAIALALLLAVLSKETMITAVPFVLLIALCRSESNWALPQMSTRAAVLIAIAAGVILLGAVAPLMAIRADTPATAYASRFDVTAITPTRLSNTLRAITLPTTRVVWFPSNVLYLGVLIAGWVMMARKSARTSSVAAVVLLAFPLAGVVLYAAWPAFPGYYSMPFALSLGTMLALAITSLIANGRAVRLATFGAMGIVAWYGFVLTWNGAQSDRAIRDVDRAAVRLIAAFPASARVMAGVPDPSLSASVGQSLVLYARTLTKGAVPSAVDDASCEDARTASMSAGSTVVVLFSHLCGTVGGGPPPEATETVRYIEIDWKTFIPQRAEVSVAMWGPSSIDKSSRVSPPFSAFPLPMLGTRLHVSPGTQQASISAQ
jgi:hypothetical protein